MRVLFVTSEVAGVYKRGGLGDVSFALPVALSNLGVDVAIVMPYYASIKNEGVHCVGQMAVDFDGKRELVFVFRRMLKGEHVPLYMIRHPLLNEYETKDMAATFGFFSACVVRLYLYAPQVLGGAFDIIHCHDWHTAFVPMMLGENDKTVHRKLTANDVQKKIGISVKKAKRLEPAAVKTILTIHNLLYNGETGTGIIKKTGLPKSIFHPFKTPLGHAIKVLREGLDYVDIISTVSTTYASEISKSGKGKVGEVLARRRDKVVGILNGIEPSIWDPKTDPVLTTNYDIMNVAEGKLACKRYLQNALKLPDADVMLFGFVGRIEPRQKGTDLIRKVIPKLPRHQFQMVILGTGDPAEEKALKKIADTHRDIVFVNTFDERLARRIYAASDVMLVPSLFEPCGLIQMIAMRYGAIPLVRKTGGLADSVVDEKTGFVFERYSQKEFLDKMLEVIDIHKNQKNVWDKLITNVMREDFSWNTSAKKYLKLYEKMMHES